MRFLAVTLVLLHGFVLHGVVLRGPTKPVCSMTEPCNEPARGALLAFARGGRVVARVRVDAHGRYRVRLAPGRYLVRTKGRLAPPTIVVRRAGRLDFLIDTGIR